MPGKLRQKPTGSRINLQEEHVGTATSEICYPRIQSCISITGMSAHGISGIHVTIATEVEIVNNALKIIGQKNPTVVFVVGGIQFFKNSTGVSGLKTRKAMKSLIKNVLLVFPMYISTTLGLIPRT